VNAQDSKAEIFDVFLCHNSEDKPAVREISQKLAEKHIKPWLDEDILGFCSHFVSRLQSMDA